MRRRSLKRWPVGEHRQAGGASVTVGEGERRRIQVRADQALRRTGALDLGDEPVSAGIAAGGQRGAEAPRWLGISRPFLKCRFRHFAFGARDFLVLVDGDVVENGHEASACVVARSCARMSKALPSRIAASAWRIPSPMLGAFPLTTSADAAFSMTMSR